MSPLPLGTVATLDGQLAVTLDAIPWTRMNSDFEVNQSVTAGTTYYRMRCTPVASLPHGSNVQARIVDVKVILAERIFVSDERLTHIDRLLAEAARLVDREFWESAAALIHECAEVEGEEVDRVGNVLEFECNARVILTPGA